MSATDPHGPHVTLRREQDYRFRVRFDGLAAEVVTDEPPPLGGGRGPNPSALLAAAVGNCLASSLLFCLRKARVEPAALDVVVDVGLERDPQGRMRVGAMDVRLKPALTDDERAHIGRCLELFESFCIVTESVRHGIVVRAAVEPQRAVGAGADHGRPEAPASAEAGS
jgi:organic hydroperoxide reductase OsmC/OhrA